MPGIFVKAAISVIQISSHPNDSEVHTIFFKTAKCFDLCLLINQLLTAIKKFTI